MALRDVSDFVSDDAGQFTFGLRSDNESRMDSNEAARQRKSVERFISNRKEKEIVRRRISGRNESISQPIDKICELRIRQVGFVCPYAAHELFAQTAFLQNSQVGACHITQARKVEFAHAARKLRVGTCRRKGKRATDGKDGKRFEKAHGIENL